MLEQKPTTLNHGRKLSVSYQGIELESSQISHPTWLLNYTMKNHLTIYFVFHVVPFLHPFDNID